MSLRDDPAYRMPCLDELQTAEDTAHLESWPDDDQDDRDE